jgi:hypothetical protein
VREHSVGQHLTIRLIEIAGQAPALRSDEMKGGRIRPFSHRRSPRPPGWAKEWPMIHALVVERTVAIAQRAIETMTRYQGVSDLNRLQTLAHRGNASLFYVSIPQSFAVKPTSEFDKVYMRQLFAEGVREGRAGTWMQEAPVTPVLARSNTTAN